VSTVVVLAKEPRPGRVKTRLCPPCTPRQAADLAAAALTDTLAAVDAAGCAQRVLAFDGETAPWLPPGWSAVRQAPGDLGRRLDAAVRGVDGPVLVIGMDTPQITPALLDDACERLRDSDAVLGPADDGGYWAIGFRHRRAGAFDGVEMSSPETARQQRARLIALELRIAELHPLRDVDTFDDARAVARMIPDSAFGRTFSSTIVASTAVAS
jgi:rSAM/selenodomain-associated transferase 1